MNILIGIPVLLIATTLQSVLAPKITVLDAKPDFVVVVVVAWAIINGAEGGMIWGVLGGLLLDFLGAAPFGTNLIALSLVGFIAGQARLSMVETNLLLALGAVLIGSLVHDVFFMLVLQVSGTPVPFLSNLALVVLPSAALNALIIPLFYGFFVLIHRRSSPSESLQW